MYKADISLTIFKIVGIWPPKCFQGNFMIYHVFTIFVMCVMFAFATSNALYLFRGSYNIEKFSESFYYVIGLSTACVKMIIIFQKRNKMSEIMAFLHNNQFGPQDQTESLIQSKFDKIGRTETTIFVGIIFITLTLRIILPLLIGNKILLPFDAWVPYSLENRLFFWLTFTLQSFGAMIAGQSTAAADTFAVVMMLQLCAQTEILIHRIEVFPQICKSDCSSNSEKEFLVNWIRHHSSLYHFTNKLNQVFSSIFFFQFFGTTLEVCTSTYLLTTFSITSMKFWSMMLSLSCVMFQVCIYCWHGHMVIEKILRLSFSIYNFLKRPTK